jgi:enoyl-CoA hydratase/carnithine racemase
MRVLDEHPETVFTVITGEGRFFSAGAGIVHHATALRPDKGTTTFDTLYILHYWDYLRLRTFGTFANSSVFTGRLGRVG